MTRLSARQADRTRKAARRRVAREDYERLKTRQARRERVRALLGRPKLMGTDASLLGVGAERVEVDHRRGDLGGLDGLELAVDLRSGLGEANE